MSHTAIGVVPGPREPQGRTQDRRQFARPDREPSPRDRAARKKEAILVRRIRGGDPRALDALVTANLGLVVKIARAFEGRGLDLDDLVGEGNLGLIRAARRFDPDFGVPFGTYAGHWIKQAMRHALNSTTATIRLPSHMVRLLTKWRRAEKAYLSRFGHAPSREAVAAMLGLDDAKLKMIGHALATLRPVVALGPENGSAFAPAEGAGSHESLDDAILADERHRVLRDLLSGLEARERQLLCSRFGLDGASPTTLQEAGRGLGISRGWASKIEKRALHRLWCQLGDDQDRGRPRRGRGMPGPRVASGRETAEIAVGIKAAAP